MKLFLFVVTMILSIQVTAEEPKEQMQMVCLGNGSKNILVVTTVDTSIEDGKDLFTYDPIGAFEIKDINVVLEIFPAPKSILEVFAENNYDNAEVKKLRSGIEDLKIKDRLEKFNGLGRRMDRSFRFKDSKNKANQLPVNLINLNHVPYNHPDYTDGYVCKKAFKTTYKPLEEPKPGMQNKSGNVQIDAIQDGDACTVGVDLECVETETNATN